MSQSLFLHLTTKLAWEDALAVGVYSLSTKGKTSKRLDLEQMKRKYLQDYELCDTEPIFL